MAKFDFDKPVASFSWYLQNGSADDKRGNRLHVGTGQNAQIYFDPESGEFIGKLKYVDDYIDLADGAKQHFELPRTAREYKPSDFSPKFPISNVNKAQPAPDRSLGHKHEVNRDVAQRMQASRENAVSMIGDHAIHM